MWETWVQSLGWEDLLGKGTLYPLQYSGLENSKECERPGFSPWVGKIPWNREHLRTLVFWPGEFHGMWETWVQSLGWEDLLGKGTLYPLQYSGLENSIQSMGLQKVRHDWTTFTFTFLQYGGIRVVRLPTCQLRVLRRQRHSKRGRGVGRERGSKRANTYQVDTPLRFQPSLRNLASSQVFFTRSKPIKHTHIQRKRN